MEISKVTSMQFVGPVLEYADAHGDGLAAIAALIGIPLVLWQIFQGARQERARARARRYAALAALPLTLSGISRWAKDVASALDQIYPWVVGTAEGTPTPAFSAPSSPDHLISAIERMIEAAPGGHIGKTLAAIVSDIQVLNSRIGDAAEYSPRELRSQAGMIDSNLLLAARIYAGASSLYDAARSLSEDAPVDYSAVSSALNLMQIRERQRQAGAVSHPTVHQMVARAYQRQRQRRRGYEKVLDCVLERWRDRKRGKQRAIIAADMARQRERGETSKPGPL